MLRGKIWKICCGRGSLSKMRRMLRGCVVVCLVAGTAQGQSSPPIVEAEMLLATDALRPGSTAKAAVVARVASGYHINDHRPTLDYLIPTELQLEGTKDLSVQKVVYPRGEEKKFAFSDKQLSVYEGTLVVGALLKVARRTPPGTYNLRGKFAYQACNDHACLPPASVPLALAVKVVGPGVPVKRLHEDVFNKLKFD